MAITPRRHSAALKANGSLWTWGGNDFGQLGDGTNVSKSSPVAVVGNHSFIMFFINNAQNNPTTYALKNNGQVWAWGGNSLGQLGDNTVESKSSPVLVVGDHRFIEIASGEEFAVALKADGSVWTWGFNASGQLGNNSTTGKSSPVLVVGNHSFIAVSACQDSCFALKANGQIWAWGQAFYGELGDGTRDNKSSPVLVVGSHSFISLTKSGNNTMRALKANGEVWGWGSGGAGALGDNTTESKSSPVLVVGSHSFIKVGTSDTGGNGLKNNGELWAWGYNYYGQLGNNTIDHKSSPVLVVGSHNFVDVISTAGPRTLALKANGEVWAWGHNDYGQLGDNTTTDRSSPVLVVGNHSFAALYSLPLPFTFNQEGYRFRNDDGTQSTATWKAAQDVGI